MAYFFWPIPIRLPSQFEPATSTEEIFQPTEPTLIGTFRWMSLHGIIGPFLLALHDLQNKSCLPLSQSAPFQLLTVTGRSSLRANHGIELINHHEANSARPTNLGPPTSAILARPFQLVPLGLVSQARPTVHLSRASHLARPLFGSFPLGECRLDKSIPPIPLPGLLH